MRPHPLLVLAVLALVAGLAATACGGASPTPTFTPTPNPGPGIKPIVGASELTVGSNRFTFALLDKDNTPITDASVHAVFYFVEGQSASILAEADIPFRSEGLAEKGLGSRGFYAGAVTFPKAGQWVVRMSVQRQGQPSVLVDAPFQVGAASISPAIGSAAPRSQTKTVSTVSDPLDLSTLRPMDSRLYQISIAEAIQQHKPFMVTFATPAFCQTQTCGPQVEAVQHLADKYQDRMSFIHVEVYDNPKGLLDGTVSAKKYVKAVGEWNLPSEPYTFLVDKDGIVRAKFEGFTTQSELDEAIQKLLS